MRRNAAAQPRCRRRPFSRMSSIAISWASRTGFHQGDDHRRPHVYMGGTTGPVLFLCCKGWAASGRPSRNARWPRSNRSRAAPRARLWRGCHPCSRHPRPSAGGCSPPPTDAPSRPGYFPVTITPQCMPVLLSLRSSAQDTGRPRLGIRRAQHIVASLCRSCQAGGYCQVVDPATFHLIKW